MTRKHLYIFNRKERKKNPRIKRFGSCLSMTLSPTHSSQQLVAGANWYWWKDEDERKEKKMTTPSSSNEIQKERKTEVKRERERENWESKHIWRRQKNRSTNYLRHLQHSFETAIFFEISKWHTPMDDTPCYSLSGYLSLKPLGGKFFHDHNIDKIFISFFVSVSIKSRSSYATTLVCV